jgi:hypothetical protein
MPRKTWAPRHTPKTTFYDARDGRAHAGSLSPASRKRLTLGGRNATAMRWQPFWSIALMMHEETGADGLVFVVAGQADIGATGEAALTSGE